MSQLEFKVDDSMNDMHIHWISRYQQGYPPVTTVTKNTGAMKAQYVMIAALPWRDITILCNSDTMHHVKMEILFYEEY